MRLGRLSAARVWAVGAFVLCSLTVLALVGFRGDELDTDAVLPVVQGEAVPGAISPVPSQPLPSPTALLVLVLLVAVTALPAVAPRRFLRAGLFVSTALMGLFVGLTALRLGLVFLPVLACLVAALDQAGERSDGHRGPALAGFETPS